MKRIGLLKNTIQEYEWGSYTAIPSLLGQQAPSSRPQAELWMGAHPKAPSLVECDGHWKTLSDVIDKHPVDMLGEKASTRFRCKLPYLFKVLAAGRPLSIQAHPDSSQATSGYERENKRGIAIDAPERNYKDDNHKPECICALTPFWALNGFRKFSDILAWSERIGSAALLETLDEDNKQPDAERLKRFFGALLTMNRNEQRRIVKHAVAYAQAHSEDDPVCRWIIKLDQFYPSDPGVLSPIILNLIRLEPGQAMFLPAGELHAYLDGLGIELMANSDNVLRGGLTPKHIDTFELLNVLNFKERDIEILFPSKKAECELVYPSQAEEFILSVITPHSESFYTSPKERSAEIILCTDGKSTITDSGSGEKMILDKGASVIVPAAVEGYRIKGNATLYRASVPV